MIKTIGPIEIGHVIGPWIRVGRYEVGIGTYHSYPAEATLYTDDDEQQQAVVHTGDPDKRRLFNLIGRHPTTNGGTSWSIAILGRSFYLIVDP